MNPSSSMGSETTNIGSSTTSTIQAVWDLQAKASPRALAVYPVVHAAREPPAPTAFSSSATSTHASSVLGVAVVYGTEQGWLHARTFASPKSVPTMHAMGATGSTTGAMGHHSPWSMPSSRLTGTASATTSAATSPAKKQQSLISTTPLDLLLSSVSPLIPPGPIVACIPCFTTASASRQRTNHLVVLVDDGRCVPTEAKASSSLPHEGTGGGLASGLYTAFLVAMASNGVQVQPLRSNPPLQMGGSGASMPLRLSCAHWTQRRPNDSVLVYASGRTIGTLSPDLMGTSSHRSKESDISFAHVVLPAPVRGGPEAMTVTHGGRVVVVAVEQGVYAAVGQSRAATPTAASTLKILSFHQSSPVYPVIVVDLADGSLDEDWCSVFLANGRECAVVDVQADRTAYHTADDAMSHAMVLRCSPPRHGTVTVASPILAAAAHTWPYVVFLQSDALISIRSPSCLSVPLRTVEVGPRPNDYFVLRAIPSPTLASSDHRRSAAPAPTTTQWIVAAAYSGECKVVTLAPDSTQELADRLMRYAIDAFGAHGFPRSELAEAVHASLPTTSYLGPEPSPHTRTLLKQYLEAVLGLADWESGGSSAWPHELSTEGATPVAHKFGEPGQFAAGSLVSEGTNAQALSSASRATLLTGTALLCLVCSQLNPPNAGLACRAAMACAETNGLVLEGSGIISKATTQVCEIVADKLLREASSKFSLLTGSSPTPIARAHRSSQSKIITDFVESAAWLLRSCGRHERAIEVAAERLQQQATAHGTDGSSTDTMVRGYWSQIKFESYTATHLSEIWNAGRAEGCRLVVSSPATMRLLESNPRLGLSVFTASHPQNESQWRSMVAKDDPLAHPERVYAVLQLLKSVNPSVSGDMDRSSQPDDTSSSLPLESGRALAVAFLQSAIGMSSGRPLDDDEFDALPMDPEWEANVANFHDELSFLLLEGSIALRSDNSNENHTTGIGMAYQSMLRDLIKWQGAKIRPDVLMEALPPVFLQEKAFLLGRVGRDDEALRILYRELNSLDLSLEYCDDRYAKQKAQYERLRSRQHQNHFTFADSDPLDDLGMKDEDNAYIPLIRVALESSDAKVGTATAIRVLTLRRGAVDRAAALRLLPFDVPVSAVARPFLIPALVDSESHVRRMTVVAALSRARYLRLKEKLTMAQLKAQSNIHVVPAMRNLNLGDPLHSTKAIRARTTSAAPGNTLPYIEIVKHFFPRHLVIQAKVTNVPYSNNLAPADKIGASNNPATVILSNIAFVVAESSEDESIQPLLQVPIQLLPPKLSGSAWCVLSASPGTMENPTAQLTCELRYTVQHLTESTAFMPSSSSSMTPASSTRTYVEELQELEVHASHFSPKLY